MSFISESLGFFTPKPKKQQTEEHLDVFVTTQRQKTRRYTDNRGLPFDRYARSFQETFERADAIFFSSSQTNPIHGQFEANEKVFPCHFISDDEHNCFDLQVVVSNDTSMHFVLETLNPNSKVLVDDGTLQDFVGYFDNTVKTFENGRFLAMGTMATTTLSGHKVSCLKLRPTCDQDTLDNFPGPFNKAERYVFGDDYEASIIPLYKKPDQEDGYTVKINPDDEPQDVKEPSSWCTLL